MLCMLAGTMVILAACTVGPNYTRPTTEAPGGFKELEGWKRAQPKDNILRGAWWKLFNDPQLNVLEDKIKISNQNVAVAEAQFRQARALVQAARAGYFPTATVAPSYTLGSRLPVSVGGASATVSSSSGGTIQDFLLPVDATWELDVWGRIRRTVESSRASAQASAADLENARLSAQAALAQAYFQLRTLDAQKVLLGAAIVGYAQFLQLTKNRYDSGVASKGDVLQAETQLKTTQAQMIDLGVQRAQYEHAIAVLIGIPASVFSISLSPLREPPPDVPTGVPSELLERRPDIAAAERGLAAANAQIGVAEAAYYPTITLSAAGGFVASSLSTWLTWPSRFWSVGPAISEIVYDGGLRRAQTDQARAAYDAAVASYRQTVLAGFQGVEDNLAALRILEEEAEVQAEAVRAAEQSVTVETNQYKAGIVSFLDVVTVQQIALTNEKTAVGILGSRMNASVLLIQALGGGWHDSSLPTDRDLARADDRPPRSTETKTVPVVPPSVSVIGAQRQSDAMR